MRKVLRPPGPSLLSLLPVVAVATAGCHPTSGTRADAPIEPEAFRARGRLVCVAEELSRLHQAAVQPVHDHVLGFRLTTKQGRRPRYLVILQTAQSKALFVDKRFLDRDLMLIGRTFPEAPFLEVSGWRWLEDGHAYHVYYWCDVCSIKTIDPGSCACCQGEVELRKERARRE